ncbi:MAG: FaeA/PapI family transcriptional regulator [Solirubrobacteraceae bacterium]
MADQLQPLLAESGSGRSARIAERAGASYSRVLALLRELESAGMVRRTGSRRSTLWLVITDEERTAQLERPAGAWREDRTQRRGRARSSCSSVRRESP